MKLSNLNSLSGGLPLTLGKKIEKIKPEVVVPALTQVEGKPHMFLNAKGMLEYLPPKPEKAKPAVASAPINYRAHPIKAEGEILTCHKQAPTKSGPYLSYWTSVLDRVIPPLNDVRFVRWYDAENQSWSKALDFFDNFHSNHVFKKSDFEFPQLDPMCEPGTYLKEPSASHREIMYWRQNAELMDELKAYEIERGPTPRFHHEQKPTKSGPYYSGWYGMPRFDQPVPATSFGSTSIIRWYDAVKDVWSGYILHPGRKVTKDDFDFTGSSAQPGFFSSKPTPENNDLIVWRDNPALT